MQRMAIISAGFVPVPAVDGGAGEVLTTEIIEGNELSEDFFMDVYTIESPKLNNIQYNNAEIIQLHISKFNWFICKFRNMFLKLFNQRYRFIPYNRVLLKSFKDDYDYILIENNMQVFEDIYNHANNGTNHMIYHMHNDIDGTTKPEYLCEFIADKAETILPVSEYIKNHFMQVAPNNKMKVLYNCIDWNIFDVNGINPDNNLKQKFGLNDNELVYMYSGRVCPEKGVLELVKAFKGIVNIYPNAKLMIVGSRWYNQIDKDEYFQMVIEESKDLEDNIIFTGYVYPKDMPQIYTLADVLVIPTMCEEAFCMVALEGMAMKIPIIATNSGGIVEVLDNKNSIIIDKNNDVISQLYNAMLKMSDEELRRDYVHNSYVNAKNNSGFNKDNYYDNFYERIIKKE